MEVLSRITRLAHQLDRRRSAAFAAHDLESWEFDVLAALRRSGPPYQLSPGRLLQETLVTSGTMTNRVDRLVARGWVTREQQPGDRRGVLVRLTSEGRTVVDSALTDLLAAERSMLNGLDPEAQAQTGRRPPGAARRAVLAGVCAPPQTPAPAVSSGKAWLNAAQTP